MEELYNLTKKELLAILWDKYYSTFSSQTSKSHAKFLADEITYQHRITSKLDLIGFIQDSWKK